MKLLNKLFKGLSLLTLVILLSHLLAFPIGKWFASSYAVSYEFNIGGFPGYLSGFLIAYSFVAALVFSLAKSKISTGLFWVIPVLLFDIVIRAYDPHLWLSFLLLTAGLGLAWVILQIKNKLIT